MNIRNLSLYLCLGLMTKTAYGIFDIQANFNFKAAVQNCISGSKASTTIECSQVINTIARSINIPDSDLKKAQNIDLLKSEQIVEMPVTPSKKTVYKFTPKAGELTGKTVYIAFENMVIKPGEKNYGTLVIKMYRYVQDVDRPGIWTEFGSIDIPALMWRFSVTPEAVFISGVEEFALGKKAIKPN